MAETAPMPPSTPQAPDHVEVGHDEIFDAETLSDTEYLAKLGYKQELNRALGLFSSFAVQFSAIAIGSAMFTTLIVGFGFFGPASFWSYIVGGGLQVFAVGLAVAQLVSAYPLSGGNYQITNRITRKPWLAWQTGWLIIIAHTVAVTAIAVSLVPFVSAWFGFEVETPAQALPWALGLIVFVTLINAINVKVAAGVNNIGVIAELVGILLIIIALIVIKHPTQPLSILNETAGTAENGWFAPFLFATILPAYLISSFDATGNAAEETKNAAKTAPLGTFIANTLAYLTGAIFFFLVLLAIPDVQELMVNETPVKYVLESAVGPWITNIFEVLAVAALIATMTIIQLTGIRVLWSQARDGQLPAAHFLRKVAPNKIPINATIVIFVISVLFALWSSLLSVLVAMTALAWAISYGVVVTAGLWAVVKKKLPHHPWHYGRFSPVIFAVAVLWSIVLCIALVVSDPVNVGLGMAGVLAAGFVIYFLIPKARRAKVPGVTVDHAAED
jgi:amino acid transporter